MHSVEQKLTPKSDFLYIAYALELYILSYTPESSVLKFLQ